jgi:outer membrane protein
MSKIIQYALVGAILVACNPAAWGETLPEVYRQSLQTDPQLQAANSPRDANQELKPQARALLLPQLNADATVSRDFNVNSNGGFNTPSEFGQHNVSVSVSQPLFNQSSRVQIRQADSFVDQADADLEVARQDLILRSAQRYFDVLSAEDTLTFSTAETEAIARQLEQAKRRFEVGLITITDVQEAQARYDLAVADEVLARNQLADRWEALRELTGQYYDFLNPLGDELPLIAPDPDSPEYWADEAIKNNPTLASAAYGVEVARENIKLQKAGHYPTLDLVAGYDNSDGGVVQSSGTAGGLQLNLPIYQGGAVTSRTREAAYNHEAAKQNLESQQRAIVREARNAYWAIQTSISRVKATRQARTSTASSLEATEAGYDVGTRTIVDVLDATREVFRARKDYAQSRYDYILSNLSLIQATGELTEEDLARFNRYLVEPKPGDSARDALER